MEFKTNEMYHYEVTPDMALVTNTGIERICEYLRFHHRVMFSPDHYFDWRLRDERNRRLSKRISSYLNKNHDISLPKDALTYIGKLASDNCVTGKYHFEFTESLDWERGTFGDPSSCFWSDRRYARKMMEKAGLLAIRIYDEYNNGKARAWVLPYIPIGKKGNRKDANRAEGFVVFNGYGLQTRNIATIISRVFEYDYKKVNLRNHGGYNGSLWINDEGSGYAISKPEILEKITKIDFQIDEPRTCYGSRELMWSEEEWIYFENSDRYYSKKWAKKHLKTCKYCNEYAEDENQYIVYGENGDTDMHGCYNCIQKMLTNKEIFVCAASHRYFKASAIAFELTKGSFVSKAYASNYYNCESCHAWYRKGISHGGITSKHTGKTLCTDCFRNEEMEFRAINFSGKYQKYIEDPQFQRFVQVRHPRINIILYVSRQVIPERIIASIVADFEAWKDAGFPSLDASSTWDDVIRRGMQIESGTVPGQTSANQQSWIRYER